MPNLTCQQCGGTYHVKPSRVGKSLYCSKECMNLGTTTQVTLICEKCGKEYKQFKCIADRAEKTFCSLECRKSYQTRENHPRWKGGRREDNGYVQIRQADGTYKYEHRVVAEEMLGRSLDRDEVVHHINEDKQDNRPENLQVMTNSAHSSYHGKRRGANGIWESKT